ncbi:hypothetical protein CC2G_001515 [Coprinopsis cinerea AmutBmut pab1-1]|nr:hypothetical protein CC2G_001515 [Coprinopsis cinerea AmutBmut pab1-1]
MDSSKDDHSVFSKARRAHYAFIDREEGGAVSTFPFSCLCADVSFSETMIESIWSKPSTGATSFENRIHFDPNIEIQTPSSDVPKSHRFPADLGVAGGTEIWPGLGRDHSGGCQISRIKIRTPLLRPYKLSASGLA